MTPWGWFREWRRRRARQALVDSVTAWCGVLFPHRSCHNHGEPGDYLCRCVCHAPVLVPPFLFEDVRFTYHRHAHGVLVRLSECSLGLCPRLAELRAVAGRSNTPDSGNGAEIAEVERR